MDGISFDELTSFKKTGRNTPMAFRFVGDYIRSQLSDEDIEFDYYQKFTTAIANLFEGNPERGRHICDVELQIARRQQRLDKIIS